jgi:hypothetical protein
MYTRTSKKNSYSFPSFEEIIFHLNPEAIECSKKLQASSKNLENCCKNTVLARNILLVESYLVFILLRPETLTGSECRTG